MGDQPQPESIVQLPWDQPGWFDQASAWIEAQLTACGRTLTGPIEIVHQRPWSVFARVPTNAGTVFFKAPGPQYPEVAVTQALARWRPDVTVPLLAADPARGWLLTRESGVTLRSAFRYPEQIDHWVKLLPQYAELQIETIDRVPELLALGAFDRRLSALPEQYAELVEDTAALRVGLTPGVTAEEHRQLLEIRPAFAEMCAQLAGYGLPDSLAHEEIHENNVLIDGDRYLFTDWSDSSVSHPFTTMMVTIRATAHWLKLAENSAEMKRLRDAYLEPWTQFAPREKLLEAFPLALRIGMVNRALSWRDGVGVLAEEHSEPYNDAVPEWLQDFLKGDVPSFA